MQLFHSRQMFCIKHKRTKFQTSKEYFPNQFLYPNKDPQPSRESITGFQTNGKQSPNTLMSQHNVTEYDSPSSHYNDTYNTTEPERTLYASNYHK